MCWLKTTSCEEQVGGAQRGLRFASCLLLCSPLEREHGLPSEGRAVSADSGAGRRWGASHRMEALCHAKTGVKTAASRLVQIAFSQLAWTQPSLSLECWDMERPRPGLMRETLEETQEALDPASFSLLDPSQGGHFILGML